MYAIGVTIIGR